MKKYVLVLFSALSLCTACDKLGGGGEVAMVKNGTLELDKSLTVGKAIDNYKYFKKTKWELVTTDNGRKVVTVTAAMDTEKHPSMGAQSGIKSADMKFQFKINQDKTFEIGWCGLAIEKNDGQKVEPSENVNLQMCLNSLKSIYNNSPDL